MGSMDMSHSTAAATANADASTADERLRQIVSYLTGQPDGNGLSAHIALNSLDANKIIASVPDAPLWAVSSLGATGAIWCTALKSFLSGLPPSIAEGSLRQTVDMKRATDSLRQVSDILIGMTTTLHTPIAGDEVYLWQLNYHHDWVLFMLDCGYDGKIQWTEEQMEFREMRARVLHQTAPTAAHRQWVTDR